MNSLRMTLKLRSSIAAVCATGVAFSGTSLGQTAAAPPQVALAAPPAAAFNDSSAMSRAVHVTLGRSVLLDTLNRVKRVYIANPQVVDSYTANPNEIVITAKAPGTSSVILWDEMGHSQAYQISSDLDIEDLALSIHQALPVDDVQVHSRENRIVLTGTVSSDAKADVAVKLATLYSKDVSNSLVVNRALLKQVRLKVRIVEIDRSKVNQFGLNFFSQGSSLLSSTTTQQFPSAATLTPGEAATATAPATATTLAVSDALNFLLFSTKLNVGATISDLESQQVLQILAEPNITTLSGEKAAFLSGGEFPFPVVQGSSGGNSTITIQFRSYGVKVEFTPFVNADGTIELKIAPEVSALDYTNAVTIDGYTIPALSTRKAETQITLRDGQSFAISGLIDKRTTDLFSHTPGIASLPVLGQLFRSKNLKHTDTELMVIVTPDVVSPLTDTVPSVEPKPAIPFLELPKFDKSLPKSAGASVQK